MASKLISGPFSLTYHPDVLGKTLYIFGDDHTGDEGLCQENAPHLMLQDFLDKVFKETTDKIDFYTEHPFVYKSIKTADATRAGDSPIMKLVFEKLEACFNPDKTLCSQKYPNVRVHYADIRTAISSDSEGEFMSDSFLNMFEQMAVGPWLSEIEDEEEFNELNDDQRMFYELLLSLTPELFSNVMDKYFNTNSLELKQIIEGSTELKQPAVKLATEFSNKPWYEMSAEYLPGYVERLQRQVTSTNPLVASELLKFYHDQSRLHKQRYQMVWRAMKKMSLKRLIERYTDLGEVIFNAAALQMDIYVLARIFKPSLQDGKEAWIYMGDQHCNNYRHFIINYLKKTNYLTSKRLDKRCLEFPSKR